MEERRKQFQTYVKVCKERKLIIGQGNPLSDILFVGCEPSRSVEDQITHTEMCLNEIGGKVFENLWGIHSKSKKKDGVHGEGATWSKYQKIVDKVYDRHNDQRIIDFEVKAFCTELNNVCASKSKDVDKSTIPLKRQLFKESDFIQSFPVVILACGSYIVNHGENRQIEDTFGVKFEKEVSVTKDQSKKALRYWIHYDNNTNPQKLVIHTRQLSGAITNELLQSIGGTIRSFLEKIGRLE